MSGAREFHFTPEDFDWIRGQVGRETGIELGASKSDMVYSRLARRLRALGMEDFASYRRLLLNDEAGEEMGHFVNALTTNLTAFFREGHHFEHLAEVLTNLPTGPVRIWSAGCSTGEEAYSVAITAREALGERALDRVRIIATDLDSNVVAHGEAGIYDQRRVAGLSRQRLHRNFLRGRGRMEGKVRVRPELRRMVGFYQLNLLHEWDFEAPFDIVFCRNVIIYFSKETQQRLFQRMESVMKPRAWLYIGHSETLWKVSERFRSLGRTVYRLED